MLRPTSRGLVAALSLVVLVGLAQPAAAQKAKRASRKPAAPRVMSSAKVKRVSPPRSRSVRATGRLKARPARRPTSVRQQPRVNRVPAPSERSRNAVRSVFTRKLKRAELKRKSRESTRVVDRERYADLFKKGDRPSRRRVDDRRYRRPRDSYRHGYRDGYGRGYHGGYRYGYGDGYRVGYRYGYCFGSCYRHYHYYGPQLVFGWHYGGFGFYDGRWHFAIVIGAPVVVVHHYYYDWWDGRYASLMTWDRAVRAYPANYTFDLAGRSCVELWIRTADGVDYELKVDPRYWNARDPGDLYAALWSELEREGELRLEDVNGAVHIFPAGMIQQLEARPCY